MIRIVKKRRGSKKKAPGEIAEGFKVWRRVDLNYRPRAYESPALPLSYTAKRPAIIQELGTRFNG